MLPLFVIGEAMQILWAAIAFVVGLGVGGGALFWFLQNTGRNFLSQAKTEAEQIREMARKEGETRAKEVELKAEQERMRARHAMERETESERKELKELEQRLTKREDTLDRKLDTLGVKERNLETLETKLNQQQQRVTAKEKQLDQQIEEERQKLLQITGLSADQAKEILLRRVEDECRRDAGLLIQRITEQAQEEAKDKSRQIILQAIQRYAAEQTCDHTVSTVAIPSDDMKGRVIGREGQIGRASWRERV